MEYFLLYLFAAVGLSHILADSSIFAPIRFWLSEKDDWIYKQILTMMTCYQCNGVWSGIITAFFGFMGWTWILWGLAISLMSPIFGFLKLYLAMLTTEGNNDDEE